MAVTLTREARRQTLIEGLHPPISRLVQALDRVEAAWKSGDKGRLGIAVRGACVARDSYLSELQERDEGRTT